MKHLSTILAILAMIVASLALLAALLAIAMYAFGGPVGARPLTPADAMAAAWKDVQALAPDVQLHTRYLSLWSIPVARRGLVAQVLAGHVNGLSIESDLVPLVIVPGTEGSLLRLNLDDYGWDVKLWERLAQVDPYFHTQIIHEDEYGYTENGKWVTTRTEKHKQTALAPWLSEGPAAKSALAGLVAATQSQVPVVSGPWFFQQTAASFDRSPNYYDFIGVKDRGDFEKLIGFDAKLSKSAKRVDLLEAVSVSGVSNRPRRIVLEDALAGRYRHTEDNDEGLDKANPLNVPDKEFVHKAEESISRLPNGMPAYGLFKNDGTRQDSAPDFIGPDRTSPNNDGKIHVYISCIRCHFAPGLGGKDGVQNVRGWFRGLFQPPRGIQGPDYQKIKEFRQEYLRDLEGPLEDERRQTARVIKQASGFSGEQWGVQVGKVWADHVAQPVTLETAAADLGTTGPQLSAAMKAYASRTPNLPPILGAFIDPDPKAPVIERQQWEEIYPVAQQALRGYAP